MAEIDDTILCDGCGVEITLAPVIVEGYKYCCIDCSHGLKCNCGDRMELEERRQAPLDNYQ